MRPNTTPSSDPGRMDLPIDRTIQPFTLFRKAPPKALPSLSLLELPPELRRMIWPYILGDMTFRLGLCTHIGYGKPPGDMMTHLFIESITGMECFQQPDPVTFINVSSDATKQHFHSEGNSPLMGGCEGVAQRLRRQKNTFGLLFVSPLIVDEVVEVLYSCNAFRFDRTQVLTSFFKNRTPYQLSKLRSMELIDGRLSCLTLDLKMAADWDRAVQTLPLGALSNLQAIHLHLYSSFDTIHLVLQQYQDLFSSLIRDHGVRVQSLVITVKYCFNAHPPRDNEEDAEHLSLLLSETLKHRESTLQYVREITRTEKTSADDDWETCSNFSTDSLHPYGDPSVAMSRFRGGPPHSPRVQPPRAKYLDDSNDHTYEDSDPDVDYVDPYVSEESSDDDNGLVTMTAEAEAIYEAYESARRAPSSGVSTDQERAYAIIRALNNQNSNGNSSKFFPDDLSFALNLTVNSLETSAHGASYTRVEEEKK